MSSGVKVCDTVKETYKNLKLGKLYRYIILGLSDDLKMIVVKKTAPPEATYDEFVAEMKEVEEAKQCRYAVYDLPVEIRGSPNSKIIFIGWSPDTAPVKQKMIYAASKDALKKELGEGIHANVQASDYDDIAECNVQKCIIKTNS